MKALILNGSAEADGTCQKAQERLGAELRQRGWEVDALILRDMAIAPCRGCFGCWVKTPGLCVIKDAGRDVARRVIHSDLVALVTPVTFGGHSSELKKALDRSACPLLLPDFTRVGGEIHHKRRYDRYPALLGVGVLAREDDESETIFRSQVGRNAIDLHSPAHAAGVVIDGQGSEALQQQIQTLLGAVGVKP